MLARRLSTILPPLDPDESFEVTRIASAAGGEPPRRLAVDRPFRAPHHTASTAALVGGGSARPRPGEVTLAHRGVLFLDELGEFPPSALDALRQPLEERVVRISRQAQSLELPGRVPADRMHQPVSVRARRRVLPLQRLPTGAVPAPALRSPARPVRPPAARRRTATGRRAGRAIGGGRRARRSRQSGASASGCAGRHGGATHTSRPVRWPTTSCSRTTRPKRGGASSRSTTSPAEARRGSVASRARSPISRTRSTSRPSTWCWPRHCEERCRDSTASDLRGARGRDAGLAPPDQPGTTASTAGRTGRRRRVALGRGAVPVAPRWRVGPDEPEDPRRWPGSGRAPPMRRCAAIAPELIRRCDPRPVRRRHRLPDRRGHRRPARRCCSPKVSASMCSNGPESQSSARAPRHPTGWPTPASSAPRSLGPASSW